MNETEQLEEMQKFRTANMRKWRRKKKLRGKWLLIKGKNLTGVFATTEEAYAEGKRRYGMGLYLVTRVLKDEEEAGT